MNTFLPLSDYKEEK